MNSRVFLVVIFVIVVSNTAFADLKGTTVMVTYANPPAVIYCKDELSLSGLPATNCSSSSIDASRYPTIRVIMQINPPTRNLPSIDTDMQLFGFPETEVWDPNQPLVQRQCSNRAVCQQWNCFVSNGWISEPPAQPLNEPGSIQAGEQATLICEIKITPEFVDVWNGPSVVGNGTIVTTLLSQRLVAVDPVEPPEILQDTTELRVTNAQTVFDFDQQAPVPEDFVSTDNIANYTITNNSGQTISVGEPGSGTNVIFNCSAAMGAPCSRLIQQLSPSNYQFNPSVVLDGQDFDAICDYPNKDAVIASYGKLGMSFMYASATFSKPIFDRFGSPLLDPAGKPMNVVSEYFFSQDPQTRDFTPNEPEVCLYPGNDFVVGGDFIAPRQDVPVSVKYNRVNTLAFSSGGPIYFKLQGLDASDTPIFPVIREWSISSGDAGYPSGIGDFTYSTSFFGYEFFLENLAKVRLTIFDSQPLVNSTRLGWVDRPVTKIRMIHPENEPDWPWERKVPVDESITLELRNIETVSRAHTFSLIDSNPSGITLITDKACNDPARVETEITSGAPNWEFTETFPGVGGRPYPSHKKICVTFALRGDYEFQLEGSTETITVSSGGGPTDFFEGTVTAGAYDAGSGTFTEKTNFDKVDNEDLAVKITFKNKTGTVIPASKAKFDIAIHDTFNRFLDYDDSANAPGDIPGNSEVSFIVPVDFGGSAWPIDDLEVATYAAEFRILPYEEPVGTVVEASVANNSDSTFFTVKDSATSTVAIPETSLLLLPLIALSVLFLLHRGKK
ncbi:MAG: hypothetical protein J4224_04940 [Candidatus Diapherotrites archaeon]|uniref:Uncharacterized protein n=1 Tax=Candidatus Iainarchaeum sp. TaxID=3101447 RepID=A0A7J4IS30_9ARCH|nr:MAG: hypothetical protein QT03_C0001G0850 [archaeon GW2011_AR10]MBS3059738.1 hypothetical protein [Candidatus Diapherotrites archaeon]HIH08321.1 hypothetical protein [Candidatus Diapherotrites archaeon]